MLTEKEFLEGMAVLMSAYPDYDCSSKTIDLYRARLCSRLTPREWQAAVYHHIDTSKWFPKVSELLEVTQAQAQNYAVEAWQMLLSAAEDGEKPELDEPTERALKAIGGWESFCYTPYDELKFKFKDFQNIYCDSVEKGRLELTCGVAQEALPIMKGEVS